MEGGHSWDVNELKISKDGSLLVSACADGTVKLWDIASGRMVRSFIGHTNIVREMDLSGDGARIASGDDSGEVILWNAGTGEIEKRWTAHLSLGGIQFSPDGAKLATGSGHSREPLVKLWSVPDGALLQTFTGHTSVVSAVFFSADGTRLMSASFDRTIREWNAASGALLRTITPGRAMITATLSPDGQTFAFPGTNIVRFATADWTALSPIGSGLRNILEIAFSRDGALIGTGGTDAALRIWNAVSGQTVQTINVPVSGQLGVESIAFAADGRTVFSGGADWALKEWDIASGTLVRRFGQMEGPDAFRYSPALDAFVAATGGAVHLFGARQGAHLGTLKAADGGAFSVGVPADGKIFAVGDMRGDLRIWDWASQRVTRTTPRAHGDWINDIAFAPNGQQFVTASYDKTLRIWPTNSSNPVRTMTSTSSVERVIYSRDGSTILSANREGVVTWWGAADGQKMRSVQAHTNWITHLSLSPDGQWLATASFSDPKLHIWRFSDGTLLRTITAEYAMPACEFSPDGTMIAAVVRDSVKMWTEGDLRVWRVADGQLLQTHTRETKRGSGIGWSSDGVIAMARTDGAIVAFEAPSQTERPQISMKRAGGAGGLTMSVSAQSGKTIRLQRCTDLPQWADWQAIVATGGSQSLPVEAAGSRGFFRAVAE